MKNKNKEYLVMENNTCKVIRFWNDLHWQYKVVMK